MKNLYIMRHAEAVLNSTDLNRKLTLSGENKVNNVSKILDEKGTSLDYIICSPAKRAYSTANLISLSLSYNQDINVNDNLYNGNLNDLISIIDNLSCHHSNVLVVGHNPNISSYVKFLLGKPVLLYPASLYLFQSSNILWKNFYDKSEFVFCI